MKNVTFLFSVFFIITSCEIDSESVELFYDESDLKLIYPESNSEIMMGIPISNSQSELFFHWNDLSEADNYQLHLIEMPAQEAAIYNSNSKEFAVVVKNRTLYNWFVSIPNTKKYSEVWSFNFIGPEIETLTPLSVIAVSPVSGASISSTSSTVNLRWTIEDPNWDFEEYDLYFGVDSNPPLLLSNIEERYANGIIVENGNQYYWKIIAKDNENNESSSKIFNFSVG